jgi:hypothetical protein
VICVFRNTNMSIIRIFSVGLQVSVVPIIIESVLCNNKSSKDAYLLVILSNTGNYTGKLKRRKILRFHDICESVQGKTPYLLTSCKTTRFLLTLFQHFTVGQAQDRAGSASGVRSPPSTIVDSESSTVEMCLHLPFPLFFYVHCILTFSDQLIQFL